MAKKILLKGQRFGDWEVLEDLPGGKCLCRCSCPNQTIREVLSRSLRTGASKSCGHKEIEDLTKYPHGSFGEWTPLKYEGNGAWLCKCSCGNEKSVKTAHLLSGASKSCGHATTKFQDLSGQIFGDWEVIKYVGDRKYECKCLGCGETKIVAASSLRNGASTNCGCKNLVDLTGKKFGMLTVLRRGEGSNWICECSCENHTQIMVSNSNLYNGNVRSCGCNTRIYKMQTMLDRYGETTASRIDNPRSIEVINACNSREAMLDMINKCSFNKKPTIYALAQYMDMGTNSVIEKIRQFELEDHVQIGVYGQMEESIAQMIESWGVEIERHNRKILGNNTELDIYIPSRNIAIEFNGTHWHSDEFKNKTYHQNKSLQCFRAGIHLIHIFEYEWLDDTTRQKLIELLKREIAPSSNKVIYARNTKLVRLDNKEIIRFVNENHLQNHVSSGINYGLTYNNELVVVMTFGKPRFTKDDTEYELIRLAYKSGVVVVGGSNRLFKAFIKEYNPNSIISYCDIAKFSGRVYGKLGFVMGKPPITEPNYVWVSRDQKIVLKRYQTMKHKLLAKNIGTPDMTENEIMQSIGYTKVHDCGNYKFIWTKQ